VQVTEETTKHVTRWHGVRNGCRQAIRHRVGFIDSGVPHRRAL